MEYRLTAANVGYGLYGTVFDAEKYKVVPYHDKCLFEAVGRGSNHSHELKIEFVNKRISPLLFYLDSFAQLFNTLKRLVKLSIVHERALQMDTENNEHRNFVIDVPGAMIHVTCKHPL